MKRFLAGWVIITALALGCVHAKICLIRLGYDVESLQRRRDEILDQNRVLQYNVLTLRSPVILGERLAQRDIRLIPPAAVEVVVPTLEARPSAPFMKAAVKPAMPFWERALRLAVGWLGVNRQAVAQTVRNGS